MKVTKGCLVMMKGIIDSGLYVLQGSTMIGSISIPSEDIDQLSLLWHRRLEHISERRLMELKKQGLLNGDKLGKLPLCEKRILGKATRLNFTRSEHVTSGILNYIHSDLWGPSKYPTLGCSRYFFVNNR